METKSYVNNETCKSCAFCADVCPNMLLDLNENKNIVFSNSFSKLCITCGHCMAICPTQSIHIENLDYKTDFFELENKNKESDSFQHIIKKRRAIRKYKNKIVPPDSLNKIADAMRYSPVGFTPSRLEIKIVSDTKLIQDSVKKIVGVYFKLMKWMKNPFMRYMMKKNAGQENFISLKEHIIPIFESKKEKIQHENIDPIFRNAPAVFLIHANKNAANVSEDGLIAMTYGFLAAESLGLGTCPISLIPPALNFDESIKASFEIPKQNKVICSFIVGHSKYKYKRAIKRNDKKIEFI